MTPDMKKALTLAVDRGDAELYIGTARTRTELDQYGYVQVNAQTATRLIAAEFGELYEWPGGERTLDVDLTAAKKALGLWNQCACGDEIEPSQSVCRDCWELERP